MTDGNLGHGLGQAYQCGFRSWLGTGQASTLTFVRLSCTSGQLDLVSRLSDGTSEKMTVLPFEGYFL
jgi:hypothetical protein